MSHLVSDLSLGLLTLAVSSFLHLCLIRSRVRFSQVVGKTDLPGWSSLVQLEQSCQDSVRGLLFALCGLKQSLDFIKAPYHPLLSENRKGSQEPR